MLLSNWKQTKFRVVQYFECIRLNQWGILYRPCALGLVKTCLHENESVRVSEEGLVLLNTLNGTEVELAYFHVATYTVDFQPFK